MSIKKSFLICIAFILLINIIIAQQDLTKISPEVEKQLENQDKVKVIVTLNEQEESLFNLNFLEQKPDNIKEFASGGYETEITKKELNSLSLDSDVKYIEPVLSFNIMLQDSAGIVNATLVWPLQISGINLTAISHTVCLIDTGVNYSHPDLIGRNLTSCNIDCIDKSSCAENCSETDLNGHGTHVAGITAASGGINGVARGVNFIALKIFPGSSSSGATTTGLKAAIDWCVENSSVYNISVITMSLGTDTLYTSYCDSLSPSLNTSITNAYNKNISVTIATGNDNSATGISLPACLPKAIPVSATDKSDNIASYSNRNYLVKLFAPGTNINSTSLSGYEVRQGTSMATPHVAGAIAIINQFLNLTSQTKTPKEIESVLWQTGKSIIESSNNFSRINLYSALNSLSFNNITLISPSDNLITIQNQTFSCNASSNIDLSNITFYLYNSTGIENYSTKSVSGLTNISNFTYNFTNEDNYKWNCLVKNNLSFQKFADANFSLTYDLTSPSLTILSPLNNSRYNAGRFNVTLNENGTCVYSLLTSNYSMTSSDNRNFSAINSSLSEGTYNITYYCNDTLGNLNSSSKIFFNIDLQKPNVTLVSPLPSDETSSSATKIFYYNVTDNLNISSCSLILNNAIVASNSSAITNLTNNISYTVTPNSYTWNINCTDEAGNIGNSSSSSFTISSPPSNTGSPGGGGSSGGGFTTTSMTYILTQNQTSSGYTNELKKDDKIKFIIFDEKQEEHTLAVTNITSNSATITIQSNPITLTLGIGQSAKLNLTSVDYYNFYIKLESIENSKAKLTIQSIHEKISEAVQLSPEENNIEQPSQSNQEQKDYLIYVIIASVLTTTIVAVLIHLIELRLQKKKRK